MKVTLLASLFLAALSLALPTFVRADEVKIEEKDVPKSVLEAVKKKYPKAKLTGFTKETDDKDAKKVTYEVKIEEGKRKIDIDLSPEGKIMVEEETLEFAALPETVKKAFATTKYAKWTVKHVERAIAEEKSDNPTYELLVTEGDKTFELALDKDGKITKETEKKAKPKKDEKAGGDKGGEMGGGGGKGAEKGGEKGGEKDDD